MAVATRSTKHALNGHVPKSRLSKHFEELEAQKGKPSFGTPSPRPVFEIKWVKWGSLKMAKWNPKDRSRGVQELADNIVDHGLQEPIAVNEKMEIVNGHRRYLAMGPDYLNWEV